MKNYQKPEAQQLNEYAEGVFMASGDTPERCRFGRTEANPGADLCQRCSKLGGDSKAQDSSIKAYKTDYTGCPDSMPEKSNS